MAPKQKLRPSHLEDPPTASSSSSGEEDQQPSSQQRQEDEVPSAEEEEEEASSQEDEEDDDLPPPPPTNPQYQPSSSETDTDSGSETESEPDPTPAKVKPLASRPMDQPQKPKPQPSAAPSKTIGLKRTVDNNNIADPKRPKKKPANSSSSTAATATAAASDDEMEEDGKKSGDQAKKSRLWSEEDELAILKGMVDFTSKTGQDPLKFTNASAFHDFMKKLLHVEVTSNQLKEKVRRLKKKFETTAGKGKNGEAPTFSKPHDQKAFELSKKVWGSEQGLGAVAIANGPVEKPKSNGSVAKSPKKKESSSRNKRGVLLNEDAVKMGLELIGESKRAELEEKWRKFRLAEMKLFVDRQLLIAEHTRLIVEALESSNN
uniref:Glabrous enhancer-binding protein-like DBD domain-containing protein n=1 Tax=Cajanus cajan TaxID=3821 RepID=A0A151S0W4_CAJCA|nr:hypothetical protein KK1_029836 [Cajanus cajan]